MKWGAHKKMDSFFSIIVGIMVVLDSGPAGGGTFPLNKRRPVLTGFLAAGFAIRFEVQ